MLTLYLAYFEDEKDKEFFTNMYLSYRKQMYLAALAIVHNSYDAEDAVHDVFYRIAAKKINTLDKLDFDTELRYYLLKSVQNTAKNMIKREKREHIFFSYPIYRIEYTDELFLETICNKVDYETILKAIQSLNDTYRNTLYYHFVLELSISETSKILDQSVSATIKQITRGKKLLLSYIEHKGNDKNVNK